MDEGQPQAHQAEEAPKVAWRETSDEKTSCKQWTPIEVLRHRLYDKVQIKPPARDMKLKMAMHQDLLRRFSVMASKKKDGDAEVRRPFSLTLYTYIYALFVCDTLLMRGGTLSLRVAEIDFFSSYSLLLCCRGGHLNSLDCVMGVRERQRAMISVCVCVALPQSRDPTPGFLFCESCPARWEIEFHWSSDAWNNSVFGHVSSSDCFVYVAIAQYHAFFAI